MERTVIVIVGVLVALWVCVWLILSVRAKQKYDGMRKELSSAHYAETPMDQQAKTFLSQVENHWTETTKTDGHAHSDIVKLAGLPPTVANLIRVQNYQMPTYAWFSLARNKNALVVGLLKANFFPSSVDRTFHVSEDGHVAFVWCRKNMVYVYRDEPDGLHATLYFTKTNDIADRPEPYR